MGLLGIMVKALAAVVVVPTAVAGGYYYIKKNQGLHGSVGKLREEAEKMQNAIGKELGSLSGNPKGGCVPKDEKSASSSGGHRLHTSDGRTHMVSGTISEHHSVECTSYTEKTTE